MISLFPEVGRVTISQRILRVKHSAGRSVFEKLRYGGSETTVTQGLQRVAAMYASLLRWTVGNTYNRTSDR
jgi:hypothetical protein